METPPEIQAPTGVVCSLQSMSYEPVEPIPLKLHGDQRPYAFVWTARHARVDLVPDASDAFAVMDAGNMTLSGVLRGRDLPLHARRPITFSGIAATSPDARLAWIRALPAGAMEVAAETGTGVIPLRGPLTARCSCSDLSLNHEAFSSAPETIKQHESLEVADCSNLLISDRPGNPPVLRLDLSYEESKSCFLNVARRGGFGLIETVADGLAIRGWLRLPPKRGTAGEGEFGMIGLLNTGPGGDPSGDEQSGIVPSKSRGPVCAWHAPLSVRFDGQELIVGSVGPNASFRVIGADDNWAEIELERSEVQFAPSARLRVPVSALFPCDQQRVRD